MVSHEDVATTVEEQHIHQDALQSEHGAVFTADQMKGDSDFIIAQNVECASSTQQGLPFENSHIVTRYVFETYTFQKALFIFPVCNTPTNSFFICNYDPTQCSGSTRALDKGYARRG